MNCAALLELAKPPSFKYKGSGAFLDCATLRRVQTTRSTQMARCLCGRKRLLPSVHKVAALASHDPRHGIHLWSWIRRFLPDREEAVSLFFPRARTPCGHGAQVIVEGREEQSDGGEKNKETQRHPKQTNTTTKGPQAESPPSCSLSSVQGETCETKKSV